MSIEQIAKTALETAFPGAIVTTSAADYGMVYLSGRSVELLYTNHNKKWFAIVTSLTSPDVHATNILGEKDPLTAICNATNEYRKVVTHNYALAKAAYDYIINGDTKTD
jgi:hypothetical protein